jgi:hypothetical protein
MHGAPDTEKSGFPRPAIIAERPRLSAEHLGQARLMRGRLRTAEIAAQIAVTDVWKLLCSPKQPHTRGRVLAAAAEMWRRRVPDCGCIERRIDVGKHHLEIEELRAGGEAEFWFEEWGEDAEHELSIALVRIELSASRKRSEVSPHKVAHISLHAATRWHERAADRSDEAFAASMRVMADRYAEILAAPSASFAIEVAEGRWLGSVARITNQATPERVLAVRTFVAA